MKRTSIGIMQDSKDLLDVCGSKNESYSDIVKKIATEYIKVKSKWLGLAYVVLLNVNQSQQRFT